MAYCERGGELIYSNLCFGKHEDIFLQMKQQEALNSRCEKKTFHIKMRIAPEDKGKLSTNDWLSIAKSYANKIGFKNNLYAIYIHKEGSSSEHIHIVSTRIKNNNLAVSDSYTHYKNLDFCREVEIKYNLKKVKRVLETIKEGVVFQSSAKRTENISTAIEEAIEISDNMNDFIFHLLNRGIKLKKGRGITFIDKDGVHIKGSKINRKYSLKGIEKMFSYSHQKKSQNSKSKRSFNY